MVLHQLFQLQDACIFVCCGSRSQKQGALRLRPNSIHPYCRERQGVPFWRAQMSARLLKKVLKEQEELRHHSSQSSTTEDGQDPGPSSPTASSSINPFDLLIDDEDDSQINPQQVSFFIPLYNSLNSLLLSHSDLMRNLTIHYFIRLFSFANSTIGFNFFLCPYTLKFSHAWILINASKYSN